MPDVDKLLKWLHASGYRERLFATVRAYEKAGIKLTPVLAIVNACGTFPVMRNGYMLRCVKQLVEAGLLSEIPGTGLKLLASGPLCDLLLEEGRLT